MFLKVQTSTGTFLLKQPFQNLNVVSDYCKNTNCQFSFTFRQNSCGRGKNTCFNASRVVVVTLSESKASKAPLTSWFCLFSLEWEAYAAKHVSIQNELDKIFSLVARWRKLELQMWESTLDYREETLSKHAFRSWFHLYELIHSTKPDDFDDYLKNLHVELDRFILQSNLGELNMRFRLFDTFSRQIHCELAVGYVLFEHLRSFRNRSSSVSKVSSF